MKAFVLQEYGSPLRQVDMPEPVLGDGEVLVRVLATASSTCLIIHPGPTP